MAESIAMIGLASAIVQLVEFGTKVVRRLREFEEAAADGGVACLKSVRNRLPLMLDLVKKIMLQMEAGLVSDNSKEIMYPVVQNCISQAEELNGLFNKTLPGPKDSSWTRGKKAVYSIMSDAEIDRIDMGLKANFELLMQAGTFQAVNRRDGSNATTFAPTFTISPVVQVLLPQQESKSASVQWDDIESQAKQTSSTQAIFMVAFPRDPNFLGRQDIIMAISEMFQTNQTVALSGLGGIGKSQIAIEYCYVFKDRHPEANVFWIYGADLNQFEQGFQEIARKARIPGWDDQKADKLKLVQTWLQDDSTQKWLIAVDNADNASMYYRTRSNDFSNVGNKRLLAQFFPQCPHGRVLITTRDQRLGYRLSGPQTTIQVSSLSIEKSKDLLRSRISEENWCEDDASRLVEQLSYLPLAITQAAAFISENSVTVSEYLEMLVSNESDFKELLSEHLEDPRRDWGSENSVIRTWKLSFEQISKESPRAAELLSLLAMLNYHDAPRTLLKKKTEKEIEFRTALGILQAFSMIQATRGPNSICKMHPLIAISTQKWLELRETTHYWHSQALRAVAEKYPGPGQQPFTEVPNMLNLTPHVQLVLGYEFDSADESLMLAQLLASTALFDLSSARYEQALEKCERSLRIRESLLPKDHEKTVESIQILGETLLHNGQLNAAKNVLERAIAGREKCLGPLHVDTLESLSDMTITLLELGDLNSAEITGQKALKRREEVLGQSHPDYLVSLNIISILYQLKGDYEAALKTTEEVLRARERLLTPESSETLMTLNNLARLKYAMGDLDAADQLLDKVVAGEESSLARNGYDIQVSLSNKAAVCVARKRWQQAEEILCDVLKMREHSLGSSHPNTIFTMEALAHVLEQKGAIEHARHLRGRIVDANKMAPAPGKLDEAGALVPAGLLFD